MGGILPPVITQSSTPQQAAGNETHEWDSTKFPAAIKCGRQNAAPTAQQRYTPK